MSKPLPQTQTDADRASKNVVPLPKQVVVRNGAPSTTVTSWRSRLWQVRYLPLAMALVMLGGVIGLYFQPPGLRKFFEITKLQPGGGTNSPIAVPVGPRTVAPTKAAPVRLVVGLGRLVPLGDVTTLSPPFGAGDARIATIRVREGDAVEAGAVLATLDNEQPMKAAIEAVRATLQSREASLAQVRDAVRASREEARAALSRAGAVLANAERELERTDGLFKRGISTGVAVDQKRTARDEAAREVERLKATLSRYDNAKPDEQPDVIVAQRNLNAAKAELKRAEQDLEKAYIRAPRAGTILTIHVRPGEKPGTKGVLNMGDIEHMTAELEVYQTEIGRVAVGDTVEISAEALGAPLTGAVSSVGLEVSRQTVVDPSPAANTDARVVKVDVALDVGSSARARRFTNLQVTGRIKVKERP